MRVARDQELFKPALPLAPISSDSNISYSSIMASLLLPGDPLPSSSSSATSIHLGPGLISTSSSAKGKQRQQPQEEESSISAVKAGLLGHVQDGKGADKWWIEGEGRRVSLYSFSGRLRVARGMEARWSRAVDRGSCVLTVAVSSERGCGAVTSSNLTSNLSRASEVNI